MARSRVLAPSDLGSRALRRVHVGGRVALVEGEKLTLADALTQVRVRLTKCDVKIEPGDLIVVSGSWQKSRLVGSVNQHYSQPAPRGDGEFARFAWHGAGKRLLARARAVDVVREYFKRQDFVEVETPLRVPAPGVDLHLDAIRAEGGFLITSPEFHMKRLLTGGLPRIFQLCHASRADEHGTLHEPEFSMLEWYRAFASYEDVLADTEQIVARVAKALARKLELRSATGLVVEAKPPFERITVRSAFKKHAGISDAAELAESDEDRFFDLLVSKVEPALAKYKRPVFLYEYPISQAALSRPVPHDSRVAERFELYAGGVELCNGYGELTDPEEQRRRIEADQRTRKRTGRRTYPIDERFLAALREGMPPSGGNALGFDRLILLATGASSIADVRAFPAERI